MAAFSHDLKGGKVEDTELEGQRLICSDGGVYTSRQPLRSPPQRKKGGVAIAQWIRLNQRSCRPGFKSQAHHQHFYHL